jgi:hypothetical protein
MNAPEAAPPPPIPNPSVHHSALPEPSELEKLARNTIGTAQLVDDAMANLHARLENMLEAVHGTIQFLVAENAELKGRLAGLEK